MIGNFKQVKKELDSIGCGFCLAKWTQVTIHLSESTHSCHHVGAHKIPPDELENNPMLCIIQKKRKSVEKKC